MTQAGPYDVESRIRSLITALEERTRRLADARADLTRSEMSWRRVAESAVTAVGEEADRALRGVRQLIDLQADELRTTALDVAKAALDRRAPVYLSADWSDRVWTALSGGSTGEWARVGTVTFGPDTLPVALPLSAGVWSVVTSDHDAFKSLVQNTIARVVAAFDPSRVRVVAYDPDLALDLAAFAVLRGVSQASLPPAITSEEELERALEALRTEVATVDDRLTAAGLSTYWTALETGHPLTYAIPLRLLVLGSSTSRLTDRGVARLDQIRRLARDRGLLVVELVTATPAVGSPSMVTIALRGAMATASGLPGVRWTPDPWAGDRFIRRLSTSIVGRSRRRPAPVLDFRKLIAAIDDPWMSEADEGLEAVIGVVDGGNLILRLRGENPPMPNALIGGAVGQGKSNVLLVLIHSLAARYSPGELEMVLVDLRDGVGFAELGPSQGHSTWLPHLRALGLEFDPDYSVAVLRWVKRQMTERAEVLKAAGATTLKQYHRNSGNVLPRLLVVIDEFQRLFEGDDDQAAEAASLLENIARTGRGFGVHLVLASQALTGIRGLATKADAIFGQFHNRISAKNTAAESQALLTTQNLAATELDHVGQIVVNDALGAVDANRFGDVPYADQDYLTRLQTQLFQQGHLDAPSVFRASSFAPWPATALPAPPAAGVRATVGLPVAVEAEPRTIVLPRAPNQAVAVVGGDRRVSIPVLVRAVTTATESIGDGARVTILDGDSLEDTPKAWITSLVAYLRPRVATVDHVVRGEVARRLIDLGRESGTTDLVVAVAIDSVDLVTAEEPDYLVPGNLLRELLKRGPLAGTWTIGWWQSKSILDEQLGYRAPGVRAWALAGISLDELRDIAGISVRVPVAKPRFVWFDRAAGTAPEPMVPFAATDVIGTGDV